MSLPPYKHRRNPCLQTENEPLIPGLVDAPLITHRCVQEKRKTSDQRVARIQSLPGMDFEYEYVPFTHSPLEHRGQILSKDKRILVPPPTAESMKAKLPGGPNESGDLKSVEFCVENNLEDMVRKNAGKCRDREDPNEISRNDFDDAKSTCSRASTVSHRSLASRCSESSRKTAFSSRSQRSSRKRCNSKESKSSTINDIPMQKTRPEMKKEDLYPKTFTRIANGLDDEDLRPRWR